MKNILLLSIFLFCVKPLLAQDLSDTIEVKKSFGTVFRQKGNILKPKQLLEITKSNQEAYVVMQKAKINYNWGGVLGGVGGFLIGWPIGTSIAGGDPNWTLAYIGGALIVASIPLSSAYNRHAKSAVKIYNDGLKKSHSYNSQLKLDLSCNGISLKFTY